MRMLIIQPNVDLEHLSPSVLLKQTAQSDRLVRSIAAGGTLVVVTGPPLSGKTRLLNIAAALLEESGVRVVRIAGRDGEPLTLQQIMTQVIGPPTDDGGADRVVHFYSALTRRTGSETRVALVIDDAHSLTDQAWAYLDLLASTAASVPLPAQMILAGRPQLWDRLEPQGVLGQDAVAAHIVTDELTSETGLEPETCPAPQSHDPDWRVESVPLVGRDGKEASEVFRLMSSWSNDDGAEAHEVAAYTAFDEPRPEFAVSSALRRGRQFLSMAALATGAIVLVGTIVPSPQFAGFARNRPDTGVNATDPVVQSRDPPVLIREASLAHANDAMPQQPAVAEAGPVSATTPATPDVATVQAETPPSAADPVERETKQPVAETKPASAPPSAPVIAPATEPAPSPAAATPASASAAVPADFSPVAALMLGRGDAMLSTGDVAGARLMYERAAAAQSGRAAAVQARTENGLTFEIYPGSSLMKPVAQFSALRRGALDLSLYPLAYAGGEVPEVNIGLMPSLVASYAQATRWKAAPIGRELSAVLDKRGVVILTWIWQAGGVVSRAGAVATPGDTKGLKLRGGSREMDLMLKNAGAVVASLPSDEIYAAMQTGSLDGAVTSSTSLISFRLQEVAKHVTTGRGGSFWFMFEPLLMSKSVFDSLTPPQQKAITEIGASLEPFALQAAKTDDEELAKVYKAAGVAIRDMSPADLAKWKDVAKDSAWKDFAARSETCAGLLKLAQSVPA